MQKIDGNRANMIVTSVFAIVGISAFGGSFFVLSGAGVLSATNGAKIYNAIAIPIISIIALGVIALALFAPYGDMLQETGRRVRGSKWIIISMGLAGFAVLASVIAICTVPSATKDIIVRNNAYFGLCEVIYIALVVMMTNIMAQLHYSRCKASTANGIVE